MKKVVFASLAAALILTGCTAGDLNLKTGGTGEVNVETPDGSVKTDANGTEVKTQEGSVKVNNQGGVNVETPDGGVNVNGQNVKVNSQADGVKVDVNANGNVNVETPDVDINAGE